MKEKAKIEAIDVYDDTLLFSIVAAIAFAELEISIFIEALLLAACGYIEENIDLWSYFSMIWNELEFPYIGDSIELDSDFLGVGAEAIGSPALGFGK